MSPIGEYASDFTEEIRCLEDLPEPERVRKARNYKYLGCPICGTLVQ
ncbi:MAG: hypothetical protein WA705_27870 [Candidatus Ozemobacteraceae bacterium]